jgi:hypothetical protein
MVKNQGLIGPNATNVRTIAPPWRILEQLPSSKTTQICCHVQICKLVLPRTFYNAITCVAMVFVTSFFATTLNLVEILVATLDRFV